MARGRKVGRMLGSPSSWPSVLPTDFVSSCSHECSQSQRYSHAGPAAGRHCLIRHFPYQVGGAPGHMEEKSSSMLIPTLKDQANPSLGKAFHDNGGGGDKRKMKLQSGLGRSF